MIIDIHAHCFDVLNGDSKSSELIADEKRLNSHANFLVSYDIANGGNGDVAVCVVSLEPFVKFEDVLTLHQHDSRIILFLSADFSLNEKDMLERIRKYAPFSYGFKLHTIIQDVEFDSDIAKKTVGEFHKIMPTAPIFMHAGRETYSSFSRSGKEFNEYRADPKRALELVKTFPDAKFIVGHSGLGDFKDWNFYLGKQKNVWVDTSFCYGNNLMKVNELWGDKKLLFGSDFPFEKSSDSVKDVKFYLKNSEQGFGHNAVQMFGKSFDLFSTKSQQC